MKPSECPKLTIAVFCAIGYAVVLGAGDDWLNASVYVRPSSIAWAWLCANWNPYGWIALFALILAGVFCWIWKLDRTERGRQLSAYVELRALENVKANEGAQRGEEGE